ncbi:MAG: redoxin domain-containing protein [Myxococcota bacterium]
MSKAQLIILAALAAPFATACSTAPSGSASTTAPGTTPPVEAAPEPEVREAPVATVDTAPPIALEDWRKIQAKGTAATKTPDLKNRIAQCKAFVAAHGGHHSTGDVLEALTDAMVEDGNYDQKELASFVEQRCKVDEDATRLPVELVREYHVKHGLPVDSALRLLSEARARLDRDWADDVESEDDPARKRRVAMRINNQRLQTHVLEGRIQLAHEAPTAALSALDRAAKVATQMPTGIHLVGDDGRDRSYATGTLDEMHLLRAAALHDLGRDDEAKRAMTQTVGFISDVELKTMYDETKSSLGLAGAADRTVTAQAQLAQDFALKDMDGKTVRLSDYRGKVVLVTFWATWCGPCKKEMPELEKFLAAHRKQGVEVLAINIDGFNQRSKVAPFLEKEGLGGVKVLFEDAEQLSAYNYSGIPALYVIDREGRVAHARTGYDPDLKNKLENEVAALVTGDGKDTERTLFTVETAPAGFDVQWKRTVAGDGRALAIADGAPGKPGELGMIGRKGLMRWSAKGEERGATPLAGWMMGLKAQDLDADGKREWILSGWQTLKVYDHEGEMYWDYKTSRMSNVRGTVDLDGDGFQEIVVQDGEQVLAMKAVPKPRWKTDAIEGLESVSVAGKDVVVQVDGELLRYGADGTVTARGTQAPDGLEHGGITTLEGDAVDVYSGPWDPHAITDIDIDGDGRNEIIVAKNSGVVAYGADGTPVLKIRGEGLTTAFGELDGKPGAEMAVFVEHYGLVVLGKKN